LHCVAELAVQLARFSAMAAGEGIPNMRIGVQIEIVTYFCARNRNDCRASQRRPKRTGC
jgi:hypothetical protein